MVGARRVTADPDAADNLPIRVVQGDAASEKDQPTGYSILSYSMLARRREEAGIERVGLTQAPKRMARLCKCVEPSSGQRQVIETKGVGGVSLGLRDRLASGPYLRRIGR